MGYIFIAMSIFGLDFFLKEKMDKEQKPGVVTPVCKGRILLQKYYNRGAILDSLENWPWLVRGLCGAILLVLSVLLFLVLREPGKRGIKLGLAMVIGGGASNLYDRLAKGHVVDYFSFKSRFPKIERMVFNVSDLFIFLGSALLLLRGGKNSWQD